MFWTNVRNTEWFIIPLNILKDKIQVLEAWAIKFETKHKKMTTTMTTLKFGNDFLKVPTPAGVVSISKAEMRIVNIDLHRQQEKGLVPHVMPLGQTLWVRPDITDDQWTSTTSKKFKGMGKLCNAVSVIPDEDNIKVVTHWFWREDYLGHQCRERLCKTVPSDGGWFLKVNSGTNSNTPTSSWLAQTKGVAI